MILYRIADRKFSRDISGEGAFLKGGRWNPKGISLVYTASNVSLASLEVFINLVEGFQTDNFDLVVINIPDNVSKTTLKHEKLSDNWINDLSETRRAGAEWQKERRSLLFEVPSAVVPIDKNYLINPQHIDFQFVEIIDVVKYHFDNRLFKTHVF